MNAATSERQEVNLSVDTQTTTTVDQHNGVTATTDTTDNLRPAQAAKPTTTDGDIAHQVRRLRTRTSRLGRHADGALVIALLAPPALIALLMALGLQFAVAVCVMFAVVFVVTTSEDLMWMWRRHTDRDDGLDLD
jgi:hypothetical protein